MHQTTLPKLDQELEKLSSTASKTLLESDAGSAPLSPAVAIDKSSGLELGNLELLVALFVIALVVLVLMWYWENLLDWLERKWRERVRVESHGCHVNDEQEGASVRLASLPIPAFKVTDPTPQSNASKEAMAELPVDLDADRFTDQALSQATLTTVGDEDRTSEVGSDSSALSDALMHSQKDLQDACQRIIELQFQLDSRNESLERLESESLSNVQTLADELKQQLASANLELESSRSDVERLTQQQGSFDAKAERVVELEQQLEQQLESVTCELNASQAQIDSLTNQHSIDLEKSATVADQWTTQLTTVSFELESSRSEVYKLTVQRDGLEHFAQRVVELETDIRSITDDLNASRAQVDSLTDQRAVDLKKSSAITDELNEQLAAASLALESSRSEVVQLSEQRDGLEHFAQRVVELEAQIDSLTDQHAVDLKKSSAISDELKEQLAVADDLKEQLTVATFELKASRSEIERQMVERSSLKQATDERVEKLQAELVESTDRLDQLLSQFDGLNALKDDLKTELDQQAQRLGLADAARVGAIKKVDVLQERLVASDKQLDALRKELAQGAELLEAKLANVDRLEDALREQQSKNDAQRDTIAELELDLASASTSSVERENFQAQAFDLQAVVGRLETTIAELKLELQQEKKRSVEACETLASSESQIAMLRAEVSAASINRSNYKSLAQKMVGYKNKFRQSEANVDQLVDQNKHMKALATEYLQNVNEVKKELASQSETIENLKQQLREHHEQDDGSTVVTAGQELVNIHRSDVGNLVEKRARKYVLELKSHFEARIKRKNALIRKLKKEAEKTSSHDLEISPSRTNWEDHQQQVNIPR